MSAEDLQRELNDLKVDYNHLIDSAIDYRGWLAAAQGDLRLVKANLNATENAFRTAECELGWTRGRLRFEEEAHRRTQKKLPCGHTMCARCLKQTIKEARRAQQETKCPTCRSEYDPDIHVPRNYIFESYSDGVIDVVLNQAN